MQNEYIILLFKNYYKLSNYNSYLLDNILNNCKCIVFNILLLNFIFVIYSFLDIFDLRHSYYHVM